MCLYRFSVQPHSRHWIFFTFHFILCSEFNLGNSLPVSALCPMSKILWLASTPDSNCFFNSSVTLIWTLSFGVTFAPYLLNLLVKQCSFRFGIACMFSLVVNFQKSLCHVEFYQLHSPTGFSVDNIIADIAKFILPNCCKLMLVVLLGSNVVSTFCIGADIVSHAFANCSHPLKPFLDDEYRSKYLPSPYFVQKGSSSGTSIM